MVIPVYLAENMAAVSRLVSMASEAGVTAITFCNSEAALAAAHKAALDPIMSVGENVGYGRAANTVTEGREFSWLILCNDDLEIEQGDFSTFIRILRSADSTDPWVIGLIGWDEPERPSVPGLFSVFANLSLLSATRDRLIAPKTSGKSVGPLSLTELPHGAVFPFVCAAINRASWAALGGFDPRYLLYYEDMDYLRRAYRVPGHHVGIFPARTVHRRSTSARLTLDRSLPVLAWSGQQYLGGGSPIFHSAKRAALAVALLLRLTVSPFASGPLWPHARGSVRAIQAVMRRRPPEMPAWKPVP